MDDRYKAKLTPDKYHVLRESGTEAPFSGEYLNHYENGDYVCGACGETIFKSDHKFDSGSGWPSFYDVADNNAVRLVEDRSHNMQRVEVRCSNCDSHLGHVFNDAIEQPTKLRYCINSSALDFKKAENE